MWVQKAAKDYFLLLLLLFFVKMDGGCPWVHAPLAIQCMDGFYIQIAAHKSERPGCRGRDPKSLKVSKALLFCKDTSSAFSWNTSPIKGSQRGSRKDWMWGEEKVFVQMRGVMLL